MQFLHNMPDAENVIKTDKSTAGPETSPTMPRTNWLRLALVAVAFIVVSVGLGFLFRLLLAEFHIPFDIPAYLAYLLTFGLLLLINLSVLPIPFGVSVMIVLSSHWNPVLIALFGSLGASIGETSGYLFGRIGKRMAINNNTPGYRMVSSWMERWGLWAVAFLSFQPVIPFEIGGFIAGLAKMPVNRFFPALWLGKFPKYLILIYAGDRLLGFLLAIR